MNEIVFIMGKSASGKDRIYRELSEDKALGLNKITMYTTRPLRSGEAEGREYHFVDDDTAKRLENENKIIEIRCYDTVFGVWKYFTADDGQIDRFMGPAGLTGLWQVEKRGEAGKLSAEERKQLDITYAKTFSFWLDIKIILKTVTAFIQKENV